MVAGDAAAVSGGALCWVVEQAARVAEMLTHRTASHPIRSAVDLTSIGTPKHRSFVQNNTGVNEQLVGESSDQLIEERGRFALLRRARLDPQKANPNAAAVPTAARRIGNVKPGAGQLGQFDKAVEKSSAVPRS